MFCSSKTVYDQGYDKSRVRIFVDNAYQSNICLICGNSTGGDTPNECSKCGVSFRKGGNV